MHAAKAVAFFETETQLHSLLRLQKEKNTVYVAVTPEADYAAEQLGIAYRVIEEFYAEGELIERGIRNFERLRVFCDRYDALTQAAFAGVSAAGRVSSVASFYSLKRLVDGLLNRVVMIQGTLQALQPNCVVCFDLPARRAQAGLDWPVLGLTSRLAPHVAQTAGCQVIWLPRGTPHGLPMPKPKPGVKYHVLSMLRWFGLERWVREAWVLARQHCRKRTQLHNDTHRPCLIAGGGYDVDPIVECWQASGAGQVIALDQLIGAVIPSANRWRAGELLWQQVQADREIRRFFIIDGVDTWPLVESALRLYTLRSLPNAIAFAEEAPKVFERLRPAVLLSPTLPSKLSGAARAGGVVSCSIQHGGYSGYVSPIIEYMDMFNKDVYLVHGPGRARQLEQPSPVAGVRPDDLWARPVSVGSPLVDRLVAVQRKRQTRDTRGRTVMYVNTNFYGDWRYHNYTSLADIGYWRFQREVVRTCMRFREVRFVFKLYPARINPIHNPLIDWLRDNPAPNVEFTDVPFTQVMELADAYIIDFPATTLIQALTTDKPVIVLLDSFYMRFEPDVAALLRKRAIVAETREQFLKEIADFLARPDWTLPQPVNDEFLMEWGTHLNDGRSAERAVAVLRDLALQGGGADST